MANEKNLKSFKSLSSEETAKIASMGGKASVEARRKKKSMQQMAQIILSLPLQDLKTIEHFSKLGIDTNDMDNQTALLFKMFQESLKGNVQAFKEFRDTSGNKPVDVVVKTEISQETIKNVESYFND